MKRLRLVGTVALALGVLLCASNFFTRSLGYAPDPSVASLFAAMWPTGLILVLLGGLIWVAAWVLQGFGPAASRPEAEPIARRAPGHE